MLLTAALALALSGCPPPPPPPAKHVLTAPRWIHDTLVTEYWPAPERWFTGALVRVPGIPGRHRADWLFGARGLPMQGEGLATDGRIYHFAGPYGSGWLNARGRPDRAVHRAGALDERAPGAARASVLGALRARALAHARAVEERRGRSQRDPVRLAHLHARALLDAGARLGLCARHGRCDRRRAHRPLPAAAGATERRPRAPRTVDARRASGHAAEAHSAVPVTDDDVLAETRAFNELLAAALAELPSVHTLPPEETRRARREGRGVFPPLVFAEQARTIEIPGRGGPISLRLVEPDEPTRRLPAHPRRRLDDRLGRRAGPAARRARRADGDDDGERRVPPRAGASVSRGAGRLRGRCALVRRALPGTTRDRRRVGGRAPGRARRCCGCATPACAASMPRTSSSAPTT